MRIVVLWPGDYVHVVERRGPALVYHHGLVAGISMDERLLGEGKKPALHVQIVFWDGQRAVSREFENVVHVTHADWKDGRAALAYTERVLAAEECRYCGAPVSRDKTYCDSPVCGERFREETSRLAAELSEVATQ